MHRKLASAVLSTACLLASLWAQANNPAGGSPQATTKRKTESFWQKVLRISGIGDNPSTLKGPGDEVVSGEIWQAEVGAGATRRVRAGGGYRSPVFLPGGHDVLALRGADIVRVSVTGGELKQLYSVPGISKLVGFSLDDPDSVLMLSEDAAGRARVGFLSVNTGKVTTLAYDPESSEDRHLIEYLRGWDRSYGKTSLFVKPVTKQGFGGPEQWTDVFLKTGAGDAVDISRCDGVNCGQPSLSADGRLVVFIKSGPP